MFSNSENEQKTTTATTIFKNIGDTQTHTHTQSLLCKNEQSRFDVSNQNDRYIDRIGSKESQSRSQSKKLFQKNLLQIKFVYENKRNYQNFQKCDIL